LQAVQQFAHGRRHTERIEIAERNPRGVRIAKRGERADTAALREVMEETGLRTVAVIGPIADIDWFFRFRGALIHKHCEFFLMESPSGDTKPQQSEGITACDWVGVEDALKRIGYENARGVLRRAREMVASRAPGRLA